MYKQRLKLTVQKKLIRTSVQVNTLTELIEEAIHLNNNLYEL
jgi:hypothetical protein